MILGDNVSDGTFLVGTGPSSLMGGGLPGMYETQHKFVPAETDDYEWTRQELPLGLLCVMSPNALQHL